MKINKASVIGLGYIGLPTAAALALVPLLARGLIQRDGIIINANSGVSGAGRKPSLGLHFTELSGAFGAYGGIGQQVLCAVA